MWKSIYEGDGADIQMRENLLVCALSPSQCDPLTLERVVQKDMLIKIICGCAARGATTVSGSSHRNQVNRAAALFSSLGTMNTTKAGSFEVLTLKGIVDMFDSATSSISVDAVVEALDMVEEDLMTLTLVTRLHTEPAAATILICSVRF
jgi:hypothetical protein